MFHKVDGSYRHFALLYMQYHQSQFVTFHHHHGNLTAAHHRYFGIYYHRRFHKYNHLNAVQNLNRPALIQIGMYCSNDLNNLGMIQKQT